MDPAGSGSGSGTGTGTGRTFWTFWNYISDIMGRFFRAEPAGNEINDTNTTDAVNNESLDCGKGEESAGEKASQHSSIRPVVLWDGGSETQPENLQDEVPVPLTTAHHSHQNQGTAIHAAEWEVVGNAAVDVSKHSATNQPQHDNEKDKIIAFNEQNQDMALDLEAEITSGPDSRSAKQEICEKQDGKGLSDLDKTPLLPEYANVDSQNDDDKDPVKDKNLTDQYTELDIGQTHPDSEATEQNLELEVIEGLNGTDQKEDEEKHHTLVVEADEVSKPGVDSVSEDNDADAKEKNLDGEKNTHLDCWESLMSEVGSSNSEKDEQIQVADTADDYVYGKPDSSEIEKDKREIHGAKEKFSGYTTNQDAASLWEVADSESTSSKDMDKQESTKLHPSSTLDSGHLYIMGNKTVQRDFCEVQDVNNHIIMEDAQSLTRQNDRTGNFEIDIETSASGKVEEEESESIYIKTKDTKQRMEDGDSVGHETHLDVVKVANEGDRFMGKLCVGIQNEGGSAQELADTFKNIPLGQREYSYKESEEVLDDNNKSDNGSPAQRFLEVGSCMENQTPLLQEEVESGAAKILQDSGTDEGENQCEDHSDIELWRRSLEEHISRAEEKTPRPRMRSKRENTRFETFFEKQEEEDLKEKGKDTEFEKEERLCDIDAAVKHGKDTHMFLDQAKSAEMQKTLLELISDADDEVSTFEDDVTAVKSVIEHVKLQPTEESSATVSDADVLFDVEHHGISANVLTVEEVHQNCHRDRLMSADVIEEEILDLWIQQTLIESSEVSEEDQGRNKDQGHKEDLGHTQDQGHTEAQWHTEDIGQTEDLGHTQDQGHTEAQWHTEDIGQTEDLGHTQDQGHKQVHTEELGHTHALGQTQDHRHTEDLGQTWDQGHKQVHTEDLGHTQALWHTQDQEHTQDLGHTQDQGHTQDLGYTEDLGHIQDQGHTQDLGHKEDHGQIKDLGHKQGHTENLRYKEHQGHTEDLGHTQDLGHQSVKLIRKYLHQTESGIFEESLNKRTSLDCNKQKEQITITSFSSDSLEDLSECFLAEQESEAQDNEDVSENISGPTLESTDDDDDEATTPSSIAVRVSVSNMGMQDSGGFSVQTDDVPFSTSGWLSEPTVLSEVKGDSLVEIEKTMNMTATPSLPKEFKEEASPFQTVENEVVVSTLDFTPQKSRICIKNPRVRPPKDFRSLLQKTSLEASPSEHLEPHAPADVPRSVLGMGFKLPGLGNGFPALKKTKKTVMEEPKTSSQETKPLEEEDKLMPEVSQKRPNWIPPSHPGFGNPLMSELKSKLKKPEKE